MNQVIHKVYKIRNKETGLFSRGGSSNWNLWTKEGKSWSNLGHVKNHLNLFLNYDGAKRKDYPYENAEIVEVEINYDMCFTTDVSEVINTMVDKREKLHQEYEERQRKWQEQREREQLEQLLKKYESK